MPNCCLAECELRVAIDWSPNSKLEVAECVVEEHGNETLVQTGRFGYWFNEKGKLNGGWIQECGEDWQRQWREWATWLEWTVEFSPARPAGLN